MVQEPSAVEQAVSRALRDNLATLQRTTEELSRAVADLVAACSSSRPTNALPPMLRAQTAAASLAAVLEVLSRFVTVALQPTQRALLEEAVARAVAMPAIPVPPPPPVPMMPPPAVQVPMAEAPPAVAELPAVEAALPAPAPAPEVEVVEAAPAPLVEVAVQPVEAAPEVVAEPVPVEAGPEEAVPVEAAPAEVVPEEVAAPAVEFDVANLPLDEQEMHRRANRRAKVAMQDIKMIRPEQVRLGRENKDICERLRDDIDKARKEYEGRFRPILNHPVDYFYKWMVDILADGDPAALGKYPYPSPALRR